MNWIIEAANEENSERHRQEAIRRGAPHLWKNICASIEQAVTTYSRLDPKSRHVEFSGAANHTIYVAFYEAKAAGHLSAELGRVSITLHEEEGVVEVSGPGGQIQKFPIGVDGANRVYLTFEDQAVTVEQFTEMALMEAFFPGLAARRKASPRKPGE